MPTALTDLDDFMLSQWSDAAAFRDAVRDAEKRMSDRFEEVGESLRGWFESHGFRLVEIMPRYAELRIAKPDWVDSAKNPRIHIAVSALFPSGFRSVSEDNAFVWVRSEGLSKDERERFARVVSERLELQPGGWINEDCAPKWPAGRYITSDGDLQRLQLVKESTALEEFIRRGIEPIMALSDVFDDALRQAGA